MAVGAPTTLFAIPNHFHAAATADLTLDAQPPEPVAALGDDEGGMDKGHAAATLNLQF